MDIPRSLEERLRNGRAVPFVGAGVSMAVERRGGGRLFPSWGELLLAGADRLADEGKERYGQLVRLLVEEDDDYLDAGRRLRKELGGSLWAELLKDRIDVAREDVDEESLGLARAVWALGSRLLVTTNYDRVLDWACPGDDLEHWDVEAVAEQARLLQNGAVRKPTVWHLHGRIGNAADLVLTPDGYGRLYGSPESEERHRAALETLRHLLAARTFLFIGFSLDDEHFGVELRGVGELFGGYSAPHYALVRPQDAERVKALGVEPVTFADFGAPLGELVEELGRRAAAGPSRPAASASKGTVRGVDWSRYLDALIDQTDHIKIRGIVTSSSVHGARHPIERLYTPLSSRSLTRRALEADDHPGALAEAFAGGSIGLTDLLPQHERLLIEGQPGAGKTTFLRFVACMLARDAAGQHCAEGGSWRSRYLGLEPGDLPPMPVFLRLADLVPLLEDGTALRHDDCRWLLDLLERLCLENDYPIPRAAWQKILEKGSAILLLDGLDEVADLDLRGRLFDVFRDACRSWQCPIVVTSRPVRTDELRDMGFRVATIELFGDREIRLFVDHWVTALHAAGTVADLGATGESYREDLLGAITGRPRVRRLAANPVMLTCLCVVHWNEGRLPEGRSRVYAAVIRWLLAARSAQRKTAGFTDRFAHRALARLALAMMGGDGGKRSVIGLEDGAVAVDAVVQRAFPDLDGEERRQRARDWLRFECLGSGIVEEVAGHRLRFWHLTFQEYLAAVQLAWRGDREDPEEDWWPAVKERLDDAQWRETVELLPGCLFDEGGEGRVDTLLDRVLALRGADPELADEARVAGIVGRLLQPLEVFGYKPRPEVRAAYDEALDRSLAIFTVEAAAEVPVKVRIAAAEALGRGGDPRLDNLEELLIEVPGCGGWRLAKYPVTVEEYQRFVEHEGYEKRKHWSAEGWAAREEEGWQEPAGWEEQLATPNRPVVGVSWFEASAYCAWLSAQRSEEIRLPSEKLWQTAATPEEGEYPWGEPEPDEERANFAPEWEPNVGSPTPVGVYPAGNGPLRHCDLAGNVWEWCEEAPPAGSKTRVLRGGAWNLPADGLRAAYRVRRHAASRYDNIGFRLAAAPASLKS